ncbi:MAG: AAC(3) family N-acetyltransferase [Candidatus Sericytochromatia bacterium]|nr:AAC(3) family N-acetyltransferase [Candidatus Tanganyikabacteria bacterium]
MRRISRAQVAEVLDNLGLVAGDHVMVHASLLPFGPPEAGVATFLDPLLAAVGPRGTVVAPTFTFGFIRTGLYDVADTPSVGMGTLAEAIRRHPSSRRSRHPIQSIAAIGAMARDLSSLETPSAYGPGSAFDRLVAQDFRILLLGAAPGHISASHLSEERAKVPYRYSKTVEGVARLAPGEAPRPGKWSFYARYLEIDIFPAREDEVVERLVATGSWRTAELQGIPVHVGSSRAFCSIIDAELAADPYWLLPNPEEVREFCADKARSCASPV